MGTELQDKRFLKLVKSYHIMIRLSLIRSSGLQLRSPDGTSLTALGPDTDRLLNTVKLGEISVPSRVYIPLMEIGLLGLDQCTTLEGGKKCFIAASRLQYEGHFSSWIAASHILCVRGGCALFCMASCETDSLYFTSWQANLVIPVWS